MNDTDMLISSEEFLARGVAREEGFRADYSLFNASMFLVVSVWWWS